MATVKNTLALAIHRILRPLIRLLISHEVSHREFSEFARRAYVDVAQKDFAIETRKSTYSRISVLTGLSRKEVTRLASNSEETPPGLKRSLNRASAVIGAWLRDPEFLDANGQPMLLPILGDNASFSRLVLKYGGNVTVGSVLDELERTQSARKNKDDTIELTNKGYIPLQDTEKNIEIAAVCVEDLLNTAVHNIQTNEKDPKFQRQVSFYQVPESVAEEFKAFSNEKSMQLLVEYNQWLANRIKGYSVKEGEASKRLGVGIYYFENDDE